ncbi:MAG: DegT/DnrJ/EryC1/StrS family aminotransferase [Candidatus Omnitrophota bacterium]|nr:DegT/DnrJ/EryC1/StrS family aminotransferase [Candidatus Omnitrophota bacterium]
MIPITKPYLDFQEEASVLEVLRSGWLTQGPKVTQFEEKFAQYLNAGYAVAVSSCTTALFLALKCLNIGRGDDVIVPSYSFIATANAVAHTGATPVFADIDGHSYNISVDSIAKVIRSGYTLNSKKELINNATSNRLKAIMPVHQVGLPADMDSILALAGKYGLCVVEDAACAVGSGYKGRKIGGQTHMACFSFHPRKIITTGEGGMVTTGSKEYAQIIRSLRQHCMTVPDRARHESKRVIFESYPGIGYNFRMSDLQAAVGISQMSKIEDILKKRSEIAGIYNNEFVNHPYLETSEVAKGYGHTYQSYIIKVKKGSPVSRDEIMSRLLNKDVATRRGIMAIHKEPAYRSFKNIIGLPITEECAETTLIIPLYPQMTESEIKYVITELKECFK